MRTLPPHNSFPFPPVQRSLLPARGGNREALAPNHQGCVPRATGYHAGLLENNLCSHHMDSYRKLQSQACHKPPPSPSSSAPHALSAVPCLIVSTLNIVVVNNSSHCAAESSTCIPSGLNVLLRVCEMPYHIPVHIYPDAAASTDDPCTVGDYVCASVLP